MSGFDRGTGTPKWRNSVVRRRPVHSAGRRSHLVLFLLGGFAFVVLLCLFCWQKYQMVTYGYRMENLKKEVAQLRETHNRLMLEQASLLTPSRISQLAQEQLGMSSPSAGQILFDADIPILSGDQTATASARPLHKAGGETGSGLQ